LMRRRRGEGSERKRVGSVERVSQLFLIVS
jgi:hypothetical protein